MTSGRVRHSISLQPSSSGPPKSSGAEVQTLDERAERAVEHDDALVDRVEVGAALASAHATGGGLLAQPVDAAEAAAR